MTSNTFVSFTVDQVKALAAEVRARAGCDEANVDPIADTIALAERDDSHSHGLFWLPGYVA